MPTQLPVYEYSIVTTKGTPLKDNFLEALGTDGWLMTGILFMPLPVDVCWYYFVREVLDENVQSK